jgi:hypothetical protein
VQSMIEINLLPGKKKRKKAGGAGITLPDFSEFAGKIRDPLMIGAIGVWVIVLPVVGFIYFTESRKLAELEEEVNRVSAQALPDFTWIISLEFVPPPALEQTEEADATVRPPVRFTLDGRTADIGAYTRFLRNLANSPWIADVQPGATQTVMESDRPVTAFTIAGTFQQADSAFIRTAPLQESVR